MHIYIVEKLYISTVVKYVYISSNTHACMHTHTHNPVFLYYNKNFFKIIERKNKKDKREEEKKIMCQQYKDMKKKDSN